MCSAAQPAANCPERSALGANGQQPKGRVALAMAGRAAPAPAPTIAPHAHPAPPPRPCLLAAGVVCLVDCSRHGVAFGRSAVGATDLRGRGRSQAAGADRRRHAGAARPAARLPAVRAPGRCGAPRCLGSALRAAAAGAQPATGPGHAQRGAHGRTLARARASAHRLIAIETIAACAGCTCAGRHFGLQQGGRSACAGGDRIAVLPWLHKRP